MGHLFITNRSCWRQADNLIAVLPDPISAAKVALEMKVSERGVQVGERGVQVGCWVAHW